MHAPPHTPPSRGPRLWTAGGRELRLKSRPPAHLVSLSNNQRLRTLQRTETQKQPSHRVTPLLAQRIPLSGNSYFWRTASDQTSAYGLIMYTPNLPVSYAGRV